MYNVADIPEARDLTVAQRNGITLMARDLDHARELIAALLANLAAAGESPQYAR